MTKLDGKAGVILSFTLSHPINYHKYPTKTSKEVEVGWKIWDNP